MRRVVWCVIACLITVSMVVAPGHAVADADLDLAQALNADVPGLTAVVNGSDLGYYGDSLRARFQNDTGQTLTVHVPIGMRLLPENTGVQTMYTAGNEVLVVPPGASEALLKGFCGEAHDAGPGSEDVFTPGGFATGDLLRTLQRINRQRAFNQDGQLAVWSRTDGYDPSESAVATRLAGATSVPSSRAAAGGAAAAVAAGGAAVFARKRGRVSAAVGAVVAGPPPAEEEPFNPEDFPDVDYGTTTPTEDDLLIPNDFQEPPPPDEDLFPPVEEPPPETPPPAEDVETPPAVDDTQRTTSLMDRVRDFLDLNTPPPEEPDPERLDQDTVDRAGNVLGAEGNLRQAMREARYPNASTDPDQQRQIQREIAEETVQQVNLEDSLENLRLIRALMVAAQTGGEKAYQLWQWAAGVVSGVYDKKVYPDATSWGPQAMLSQRGLKGLYNDYRDTFSFMESFSADTPRNRREICEQRDKTDQERLDLELSWADSGTPADYEDPYYRRVARRAAILEAMETAFDHEPDPRRQR